MRLVTKIYRPISWPTLGAGGETGSWRTHRPVVDVEKCNKCQICWVYCPEAVIDRLEPVIDYRYCKGCGVCALECPTGAISMEQEE
ncbi:MAG TPA: 4Fe-4S binding protein [Syntrophomonadaceae bacterium]|jgi:pyruvate ferredoxin oxidoreductase delta subunit|nr:4Fe-4S binding protein [Syntrophomonadaceae bacterium]